MTDDLPPLLTGGARRRRGRRPARPRSVRPGGRRPRFVRGLFLVPVVGAAALLAILLASSGSDSGGSGAQQAKVRPESLAQPPAALDQAAGGGGDASRFAVKLSGPDLVHLRFTHPPRGGVLFDVRSGHVLWRLDPTRRLAIASLTKMMTALVVVERRDPHERVRITSRARHTPGSAVGVLPAHRKVQLEALLNGLLLVSGNDAAVALAQHTGGSVAGFVRMMNERVRQLGLSCTHYTSPHGLQDAGNRSCAADLATLARADLHLRRIRRVTRRDRAIVAFPIKGGRLFLYNNNPLIRGGYRGVTGLKTGYTDRAGHSIVATAKRGNVELGVVLLHAYNIGDQAEKLLDRGFTALHAKG